MYSHADGGGTIDPDDVRKAITVKTRLIAITHASNVLGTVQPIDVVGRIAREQVALLLGESEHYLGIDQIFRAAERHHADLHSYAFPLTLRELVG